MATIEKRVQALEDGAKIVAIDVVGKLDEVSRDVRELGRESREQNRALREVQRDVAGSFEQLSMYHVENEQQVAAQFAAVEANRAAMETRILDSFQQLIKLVDERLPPQKPK